MLDSLKIQNYKVLKSFGIAHLGRLNLIVGKNNSGKSTLLECIRILAAGGNPLLINDIITAHDDEILVKTEKTFVGKVSESVNIYEGLFSGRSFPADGSPIFIGTTDHKKFVEIRRAFIEDSIVEKDVSGEITTTPLRKLFNGDKLHIMDSRIVEQTIRIETYDDAIFVDRFDSDYYRERANFLKSETVPLSLIPAQFLSMDMLADIWDKTIMTGYFVNVKKFLELFLDNFEDIAFVKANGTKGFQRTGIVRLKNHANPVPLNSMGDGILKILQIVLGAYPATGGILLIEEFENGLHFSIQKQLWELLFELAATLNIQVFATTHSWDCIEAFACIAEEKQEDAVLIKISKGRGKLDTVSTIYEREDLVNLTQADVEIR
jgi:predicted ATPase